MLISLSPEVITILLFIGAIALIILGCPIAFALAGVATIVGVPVIGMHVFDMFRAGVYGLTTSYTLLAVPLFVFMGNMVESTGITGRMFEAFNLWIGRLRGGLAIISILIGTILAACVGVIAASVVMLTLLALPVMIDNGYDKSLATGAICAGGSLGILIPPSVMLVLYGPAASLSVGKLFMAAIVPGLLLSLLYIIYIFIICRLKPSLAPMPATASETIPLSVKLKSLVTSLLPPLFLIFAVLGSIILGLASPTEAASVGALASILLALAYRSFNFKVLKKVLLETLTTYAMVLAIAWGAKMFTTVFLKLGCGSVVADLVCAVPGGKWGSFLLIMIIVFILGMFIDWIGIIFIMVPIITPLVKNLGFDPIWFAMMIILNLQLSFITPPFAYSIFYLKGVAKPEWGISTRHIIKGIIPYIGLIFLALFLCILFPNIILWLPNLAIR